MNQILSEIIEEIQREASLGDVVSMTTRMQQKLNDRGMRYAFTEDELRVALDQLGVPGNEIDGWFEEMASWL